MADGHGLSNRMPRLIILVEGHTEVSFIDALLAPHLYGVGHMDIRPMLLGNHRGGISQWAPVRSEIEKHLLQSPDAWVTTMVDYSGMLESWPGRRAANGLLSASQKAHAVEQALLKDILALFQDLHPVRFIPFVVMHEYEGLLFSEPSGLADALGNPGLAQRFREIRDEFRSPEEINASYETRPSRRISHLFPGYRKRTGGVRAAQRIGLETMRDQCPLFDDWVKKLENLI